MLAGDKNPHDASNSAAILMEMLCHQDDTGRSPRSLVEECKIEEAIDSASILMQMLSPGRDREPSVVDDVVEEAEIQSTTSKKQAAPCDSEHKMQQKQQEVRSEDSRVELSSSPSSGRVGTEATKKHSPVGSPRRRSVTDSDSKNMRKTRSTTPTPSRLYQKRGKSGTRSDSHKSSPPPLSPSPADESSSSQRPKVTTVRLEIDKGEDTAAPSSSSSSLPTLIKGKGKATGRSYGSGEVEIIRIDAIASTAEEKDEEDGASASPSYATVVFPFPRSALDFFPSQPDTTEDDDVIQEPVKCPTSDKEAHRFSRTPKGSLASSSSSSHHHPHTHTHHPHTHTHHPHHHYHQQHQQQQQKRKSNSSSSVRKTSSAYYIPKYVPRTLPEENAWKSGICDCWRNPETCCVTGIAPCITFGRIAESVDNDLRSCVLNGAVYCVLCLVGLCCCYSSYYRTKIRTKYGLPGSASSDMYAHCLCECCALAQEFQEQKDRTVEIGVESTAEICHGSCGAAAAAAASSSEASSGVVLRSPPIPKKKMNDASSSSTIAPSPIRIEDS